MNVSEVTLEETCDFLSGFAWSATKFNTSSLGIPIIRIQNVDTTRDKDFIYWDEPYDKRFVIEKDDLLLTLSGSFRVGLWDGPSALLNQRVVKLIPKKNVTHEWLLHVLRHRIEKISNLGRHALVSNVALADLRKFSVPLPPLVDQRRIAAILDQADALRAKRREALAQLDSLTQSIFIEMFGDPVSNPKGWALSDVGTLCELQGGLQVSTARKGLPLQMPYLRVANVYRGRLDLTEMKTIQATVAEVSRTTLVKGDLLIVEGHGNPNEVGRSALWSGEISPCIHQNHIIRVRFDASKILPTFACEYLNSSTGRRHLLREAKTTSGLNTINASNVRGTPISVPPISLQKIFTKRIQSVEALKSSHQVALQELDTLFASLQHRAFQGEL